MYSEILFWSTYILIFILILIFGYSLIFSFISKIPFIPSKKDTIKKMIQLANLKPSDKIADLGCGNMKILIVTEKRHNLTGTGYEISPLPYLLGKLNLLFYNSKNKLKFQNIFNTDLSKFNVIFIYLTPPILKKLEPKILDECKPGTKIISNTFSLPNLKPEKTIPKTKSSQKILLYQIKK